MNPSDDFLPLVEAWDGEGVVIRHDRPSGTWIFIALHSCALGRPTGGSRLRVYPGLRDAMRDAMRLAEGMTYKWAGLGLSFGGGKAVLAIKRALAPDERRALMHRYGELIESLAGAFHTGADLGTSALDMSHVAEKTRYVLGVDGRSGLAADPGPYTAIGVHAGMRSAVAHVLGADSLAGCRVLVQGLGGVGLPLARMLVEDGAELLVSDLDEDKAKRIARELGATQVAPDRATSEPCDVFAPCATGGILGKETIATLGCKIVAGSANNQLQDEDDAERLKRWGIVYVPDYIVNAGGALAFSLMKDGITDETTLRRRVAGIGQVVGELFTEAGRLQMTLLEAARHRVDRWLALRKAQQLI
jgi:leucine dehydrogenase